MKEDPIALAKEYADKISSLLGDPHPGLFTWMDFLHDYVVRLVSVMGYDLVPKGVVEKAGGAWRLVK